MKNRSGLAFIFASSIFCISSVYGQRQTDKPAASFESKPFSQYISTKAIPMAQRKKELIQQVRKLEKEIDKAAKNRDRLQKHRDILKRQLKEL